MVTTKASNGSTSAKWILFAVLAGSHFLVHFQRLSTGVMAQDLMQSLGISTMTLGWVAASYFYAYALFQIPCGMLADTWGVRHTLTLFMVASTVGSFVVSFSTNAAWVSVGRAITGAGLGSIFVISLKALGQRFGRAEFAGVVGLFQTVGHFGALAASAPLVILAAAFGWRGVYRLLGLLGLLVALAVWFVLKSKRASRVGQMEAEKGTNVRSRDNGNAYRDFLRELTSIFTNPGERRWLLLLGISHFMKLGPVVAFQGLWGSSFLTTTYGLSRIQAGSILMMVAVGYIVGGPLAGYLSDKVLGRRRRVIIASALLFTLGWVPLVMGSGQTHQIVPYITVLMIGLGGGSLGVMTFAVVREVFSQRVTGTANSVVNTLGTLAVSIYQPLMGLILDRAQALGLQPGAAYQMALLPCLLSGAGVFCVSLAIKETLLVDGPPTKAAISEAASSAVSTPTP